MGVHLARTGLVRSVNVNIQCVLAGVGLTPIKMVAANVAPLQSLRTCNEGAHPCRLCNPADPEIERGQFPGCYQADGPRPHLTDVNHRLR